MRSHLATKRLSAYIDDELPDREQRLVEAHVSECPACQTRLHGLRLVVSELQRVPAVEAPSSLARSVATEAAMRWGPHGPGRSRLLGRRGLDLIRDMIQLGAVTAGAMAIIALLVAYGASRQAQSAWQPPATTGQAIAAADRAGAGGRSFVFVDGAWWQEDLLAADADAAASSTAMTAQDALSRAPWLAKLLRRGPVIVEFDGARRVVDFEATAPRRSPTSSSAAD